MLELNLHSLVKAWKKLFGCKLGFLTSYKKKGVLRYHTVIINLVPSPHTFLPLGINLVLGKSVGFLVENLGTLECLVSFIWRHALVMLD